MKNVAVVTGASAGIGEATVNRLIERGYTTYAAAGRLDRIASLEKLGAILLPLDLTQDGSIVQVAERIRTEQIRIVVLVNNACYGSYGAGEDVPLDEARRQFEVNVFGLARLVQLVTPLMRQPRSGKILNVSSVGARDGGHSGPGTLRRNSPLKASATACAGSSSRSASKLSSSSPGPFALSGARSPSTPCSRHPNHTAYGPQAEEKRALFLAAAGSASDPDVVAREISKAIQASRPKTRYAVGAFAKQFVFMSTFMPDRLDD
jgi:NAD(P)-dependent dehydrogenase (short-subunit alcohol dehydrogenase family)